MYSRPSARLLVWAVHAGRSSRWTTASPFSQPQLARRPKVPAEHVWSSCLCCGCASNLEFTVGWTAKPGSPQCHLPTQREDVSVSTIPGASSALEALCDYVLYKSTFALHYIGNNWHYIGKFLDSSTFSNSRRKTFYVCLHLFNKRRLMVLPVRYSAYRGRCRRAVSVCPSVCLSHAGVVSERLNLSQNLFWTIW